MHKAMGLAVALCLSCMGAQAQEREDWIPILEPAPGGGLMHTGAFDYKKNFTGGIWDKSGPPAAILMQDGRQTPVVTQKGLEFINRQYGGAGEIEIVLNNDAQTEDASDAGRIFTSSSLETTWTLHSTDTMEVLGLLTIDMSGEDPSAVSGLVTFYPSQVAGLEDALDVPLSISVLGSETTEVQGLMATATDASGVSLQLTRPPNWQRDDNIFHGLAAVGPTGKIIRAGIF